MVSKKIKDYFGNFACAEKNDRFHVV